MLQRTDYLSSLVIVAGALFLGTPSAQAAEEGTYGHCVDIESETGTPYHKFQGNGIGGGWVCRTCGPNGCHMGPVLWYCYDHGHEECYS